MDFREKGYEWVLKDHEFTSQTDVIADIKDYISEQERNCYEISQIIPKRISIFVLINMYNKICFGEYTDLHEQGNLHVAVSTALEFIMNTDIESRNKINFDEIKKSLKYLISISCTISLLKEFIKMQSLSQISSVESVKVSGGYLKLGEENSKIIEALNNYVCGQGRRCRLAKDTNSLILSDIYNNKSIKYYKNLYELNGFRDGILLIQKGVKAGSDIDFFKGTWYEFLPRYSKTKGRYDVFLITLLNWIDIFNNVASEVIYSFGSESNSLKNRDEFIEIASRCTIIQNFSTLENIVYNSEQNSGGILTSDLYKLTKKPIVNAGNDCYITSLAMIIDAINIWIEESIYCTYSNEDWCDKFRDKMASKFVDDVKSFMREEGYQSGTIEQNGKWNTGDDVVKLKLNGLPGEIDLFCVNKADKRIYLIECKRIQDFIFPESGYKKLCNSIHRAKSEYMKKLFKKYKLIEKYVEDKYPGSELQCVLLFDIDFPILVANTRKDPRLEVIKITDFDRFSKSVRSKSIVPSNTAFYG